MNKCLRGNVIAHDLPEEREAREQRHLTQRLCGEHAVNTGHQKEPSRGHGAWSGFQNPKKWIKLSEKQHWSWRETGEEEGQKDRTALETDLGSYYY